MSTRAAAWLAWSMCVLSLVLTAISLVLLVLNRSHSGVDTFDYWIEDVVLAVFSSTVGAMISSRRRENLIGWIMCAIGLIAGVDHLCAQYATYALLAEPGSLPGGAALSWIRAWIWVPHIGFFVFLGLLFPNGQLPSRRWRSVAWISAIITLIGAVLMAFSAGPIDGFEDIYNPLGTELFGIIETKSTDNLVDALLFLLALVATTSLFVRLRRASEVERQQIKWLAYAATVAGSSGLVYYVISEVTGASVISWVSFTSLIVGLAGIPIAVGIAIIRYHLYDIDIIISKTFVYSSVISILVALFELNVIILSSLFSGLAEHYHLTESHWLAEVMSAVAIAVLFDPLKDRIQQHVDRRLFRTEAESRTLAQSNGSSST